MQKQHFRFHNNANANVHWIKVMLSNESSPYDFFQLDIMLIKRSGSSQFVCYQYTPKFGNDALDYPWEMSINNLYVVMYALGSCAMIHACIYEWKKFTICRQLSCNASCNIKFAITGDLSAFELCFLLSNAFLDCQNSTKQSQFLSWKWRLPLWHILNQNASIDPKQPLKRWLWDLYM